MSAPDPRRQDDDPDLHLGFDQELDLAAERPWAEPAQTRSGPGWMVAAIVASSLGLAGIVTLVRDARTDRVGAAESPQEAADPEPEPVAPPLAELQPPLEPVAPTPSASAPVEAIVPAAVAIPSPPVEAPTPVAMGPQPEGAGSTAAERGQAPMPAPVVEEEPAAATTTPAAEPAASVLSSLPSVEESIFEPEDEAEPAGDGDDADEADPPRGASREAPDDEAPTDEPEPQRDASAAPVLPLPLPV
ncbi:MAG: hypothetical protein KDK70_21515 [Myxococcales bacterium]|nr:hypothetical protein [Myxococcales bacterium]